MVHASADFVPLCGGGPLALCSPCLAWALPSISFSTSEITRIFFRGSEDYIRTIFALFHSCVLRTLLLVLACPHATYALVSSSLQRCHKFHFYIALCYIYQHPTLADVRVSCREWMTVLGVLLNHLHSHRTSTLTQYLHDSIFFTLNHVHTLREPVIVLG